MTESRRSEHDLSAFEKQIGTFFRALRRHPARKRQILVGYASTFFEAVKESIKKKGMVGPLYIIVSDPPVFGVPPMPEEDLMRAREAGAEAVLLVEGFQSKTDIADVLYHVSLSSPFVGVMGWVLKVRLLDLSVEFRREYPYFFDAREKVKSLGELIEEMDSAAG